MSAKKKEKSEWRLCPGCECYFPRSVCMKHEKTCNISVNSDHLVDSIPDATASKECTGFIKHGNLHGICKYIDQSNNLLPTNKNDLIIVHPSAIKLCKFQITSCVLIKYDNKQTCGMIWPSSQIPVDGIGLRLVKMKTLELVEGSIVTVQLMDCPSIIADKVELKPLTNEARSCFSKILPTLLLDLHDCSIMKGDIVSIPYYGDEKFYRVDKVDGGFSNVLSDTVRTNNHSEVRQDIENGVSEALAEDLSTKQLNTMFDALTVNGSTTSNHNTVGICQKPASFIFVYSVLVSSTRIVLNTQKEEKSEALRDCKNKSILDRIGGLGTQIKHLEELIEFPFTFPTLYTKCGIYTPKGVIIHGVSGTGKTSLVYGFVDKLSNVYSATINGPELTSKFQGETEQKLRDIFNKTKANAPSILIIDEFDAICPSRTSSSSESEKRVVATLLTLLDSVSENELFVVIAITSKLEQIDLSLRRPGRFDTEIEISVPNATERCDILQKLITGCRHSLSQQNIIELSEVTHGYVGSDLSALVKEAGMIAMNGKVTGLDQGPIDQDVYVNNFLQTFSITFDDFKNAMCNIRVNAMKAVMVDIPKVYWKDIGGQHSVKQRMKEAIEWPLKHPDVFKRMGIRPSRGLLMYGPPGCSKTLIAKALATESGLNFISIKGPELFNKYLGESERAIREVFHKARVSAPSIVFFDEIDAVGVQRSNKDTGGNNVADRVLAQLLTELDGVESLDGVIIIAATNRPDIIDPALLRPGRIDHLVYVPLPDDITRKEIFEIQFRDIPISKDVDLDTLVAMSAGYSGAELCSLCREAAMCGLRENFECIEVSFRHFKTIFEQMKPAISEKSISFYNKFMNENTDSF